MVTTSHGERLKRWQLLHVATVLENQRIKTRNILKQDKILQIMVLRHRLMWCQASQNSSFRIWSSIPYSTVGKAWIVPKDREMDEIALFPGGADVMRLCKNGQLKEALNILEAADYQGIEANLDIYVCLLQGCINVKSLVEGKRVHAHILKSFLNPNILLLNTLVNMYFKCGSPVDAQQLFEKMFKKNVCTWTTMIAGYTEHGQGKQALELFWRMMRGGVKPVKATYVSILKACARMAAFEEGNKIHAYIVQSGYGSDIHVGTTLVDMYAKCKCIEYSRDVFDRLPNKNVVSWTAMIAGYAQYGQGRKALELFDDMERKGVKPNKVTFISVIKACSIIAALEQGKRIHARIIKYGFEFDPFVGNSLIDMYAKCGSIKDAHEMFEKIDKQSLVPWNTMIAGYARHGHGWEALKLYWQLEQEGIKQDDFTFVAILKACASITALEEGKKIHACIIRHRAKNPIVYNALIDMYAKCGSTEHARKVFDEMPKRDVLSWNTIITSYAQQGQCQDAIQLFQQMIQESVSPDEVTFVSVLNACASVQALEQGKEIHGFIIEKGFESDVFLGSALIDMYAKCGSIEDARKVFDTIPVRNVVTWNAMITAYLVHGESMKALDLFQGMQRGCIKPDSITFASILKVCASEFYLEQGKQIHSCIIESRYEFDTVVGSALIAMYAKCGSIGHAWQVFTKLPRNDTVIWNAMISAYVNLGQGKQAFELFSQMEQRGVIPDKVTFISLIKVCTRTGALEQGKQIHEHVMKSGFQSDLFVGSSLVDMYGKCRSLKNARTVFDKMYVRDVASWNVMIAGYCQHGQIEQALVLLQEMEHASMEPNKITFVNMLKACANFAALDKGRQIHKLIIKRELDTDLFVGTALVDMYSKCGSREDAWQVFDKMPKRDLVSWNAIIACYAQHGHEKDALHLAKTMVKQGIKMDHATFVGILSACSHAGLVHEGSFFFDFMCRDHGIIPTNDHYVCMVDLFGRVGCLEVAEDLIKRTPLQTGATIWTALLGACRIYGNVELGKCAAKHILELESHNTSAFALLSNIYAAGGRDDKKAKVKE